MDLNFKCTQEFASVVDDSFRKYDPATCLVTLCCVLAYPYVTHLIKLTGTPEQEIETVKRYCRSIAEHTQIPYVNLENVRTPMVQNKDFVDWIQDNLVCDDNPYLPNTFVELFRNLNDGIDEQFSFDTPSTIDFTKLDFVSINEAVSKIVAFILTEEFFDYCKQKLNLA